MITFEEAREIAKKRNPDVHHCTEFANGFSFEPKDDGNRYVGGYGKTPVVVLKESGEVTDMIGFITTVGAGELIREIDF